MYDKCLDWVKESARRGDVYYTAITKWMTSRFRTGSLKAVRSLAKAYRSSLDKALACLRGLKTSPAVESQIALTQNYKHLVAEDLAILENFEKRPLPPDLQR
jgi:hypothetical protein